LADRIELRVVDRGPGIPEQDREKVFAPFQRLGDTDNSTGIGIGLALSRGLTESMGGSLVPEATPGGGLTMVIRLPVGPLPSSPPAPDTSGRGPSRLPPGIAHWIEELPAAGHTRLDERP